MRAGSLCTGIGGLDLAVEAHFGAELVWYSELEAAPCTVLEREWPGVPNLRDLTAVDWSSVEPVDVLSAGYPCQPFSHAGKRQGANDVRHLWPYIAEAVRVLRPRWVVLENVAGHLTLGFGDVLGDLAEAGFDAEWCLLRASDVGAPHQRARLFIVASDARRERHGGGQDGGAVGRVDGRDEGQARQRERARALPEHRGAAPAADPEGVGRTTGRGRRAVPGLEVDGGSPVEPRGCSDALPTAWGVYEPAIRRWELVLRRPAPAPTTEGRQLNPRFVEWMMGYPEGWVEGLSRTQALKALGNAVVPQQCLAALRELAPVEAEAAA